MPCAPTHRLINFCAGVALLAAHPPGRVRDSLPHPLVGGALCAACATLPDLVEPALRNPHHRQFFHSLAFAGMLGWGVYEVYKWEPDSDWEKVLRLALIAAGAAYLLHLLSDA